MITQFIKDLLIKLFGQNYETTVGSIMTTISLIPQALQTTGIDTLPSWIRIGGVICAIISFIYFGTKAKSKTVTGVEGITNGVNDATRKEQLK